MLAPAYFTSRASKWPRMEQLKLEVDPAALELAEAMLARDEVFRAVLEETLDSADGGGIRESGRTVCGNARSVLPPLSRSFARVTLPTCPVGTAGTWHTHITKSQFLDPINSLPDFANVAFGVVDVSIVAGANSSHVVVATEGRSDLQDLLVDELGIEVQSPGDVARAVIGGEVADPPGVRDRLYGRLGDPLAFRVDTRQPDLAERAEELEFTPATDMEAAFAQAIERSGCTMYRRLSLVERGRMERVIEQSRELQDSVHDFVRVGKASDFNFRQQVLATTLSVTVGNIVERLLFG